MLSVKEAAEALGVCTKTVRRWEREGRLKAIRTPAGHRRFDSATLMAPPGATLASPPQEEEEEHEEDLQGRIAAALRADAARVQLAAKARGLIAEGRSILAALGEAE